jgi:hypothetical protein
MRPVLDPLVTGSSLDIAPLHVVAVVLVAVLIGLLGTGVRRFLVAAAVELIEIWHGLSAWSAHRALGRRRLPAVPWFCDRCRSANVLAASRCYSCGAPRELAEAAVPDADVPVGASAGRSQRTRRRG